MTILLTVIIFSILIIIHEFGHFISARVAGIKVEKFSIGFGPVLLKIKGKETEFLVSLFPLGGYVKLAGDTRSECKGRSYEFFSKSIGVRSCVVFFGPLFNIIFSFFVFWMIACFIGFPSQDTVVGGIIKYNLIPKGEFSKDELSYLKDKEIIEDSEDKITYIVWNTDRLEEEDLRLAGFIENEQKAILDIWDNSSRVAVKKDFSKDLLDKLIYENVLAEKVIIWLISEEAELGSKLAENAFLNSENLLKRLNKYSYPAYKAGVLEGDTILKVNGESVSDWAQMTELIRESKDLVSLIVLREGETIKIDIEPKKLSLKTVEGKKDVSMIGIESQTIRGNLFSSLIEAGRKSFFITANIIKGLALLITDKLSFKDAVTGPIGIAAYTAEVAKGGFVPLFNFAAMLSLSLAVINLFPFPVLDGGHLLFMLLEKIRRKPLSEKTENVITQVGITLLLSLMLFVSYNDISRLISSRSHLSQNQLERLKDGNFVKEIDDYQNYIFWNFQTEDALMENISEIKGLDDNRVLLMWKNSKKVTKIIENE